MNMEEHNGDGGQVKSDETLFAIIEELHRKKAAGVTELSSSIGLPKSTIHRHLKTLEKHRYVLNVEGEYKLSFKFLMLGGAVHHSNRLCSTAIEFVHELADRSNKLATFAIKEYNQGIFTYRFNDKYDIKAAYTGRKFYLHQNAAGKAMLATLSDEEIEQIIATQGLPAETENTITDSDALFEELETIRKRGFAVSVGERMRGAQSISTTVYDDSNDDIGALSLTTPVGSISKSQIQEQYAEIVMDLAGELEFKLR
jgi:DNA-binding IclR family transcriptional regulator